MRNVLTAGENSPRVTDHFPASRASRWKNQIADGGAYEINNDADPMRAAPNRRDTNPAVSMHDDRVGGQFHNGGP